MKCPYCGYRDEARPKFCPNCGRLNKDDIAWNTHQVNESMKRGQATKEDLRYMAEVKQYFGHAAQQFSKIDMRTPLEIWATRIGWITGVIGAGILAYSLLGKGEASPLGIALGLFGIGLLGVIAMLNGKARFGIRASCLIPFFLVGGLIILLSLAWGALFPDRGPVRDNTSVLYNCYSWDKITPSMVGSNLCVYGKILKYSVGSTTTDIYFGNNASDFHLISTNYDFPEARQGQCVKASGIVSSYYGALSIDISDLSEVTPSSACDK